ncbi:hypothetical protein K525DRAFT_253416 [Schizophyllum commune Loenen D]|nr:hypothetical protein K525DRAFT_253416 [Schizophyllum commune Loenen D]
MASSGHRRRSYTNRRRCDTDTRGQRGKLSSNPSPTVPALPTPPEGGVDVAELRLSGHDEVKCHYAGLTQSSIVHHAILIAVLHPKLQQRPSKLEAEASRRLQRNSPSKRITETSPSPHSTPLEAASAQLLTKSEGIKGMGHRRLPGLPPSPHDLEASSRQQRKTFVVWDTVDASSPPGKRPFVRRGWGGVGAFSPVITRLVDIEKRAISALGGLRGERDRRGEGGMRTPSRRMTKTPVGALSAQEVSSDGGSAAYAVLWTHDDAERPGLREFGKLSVA